jgi:hypothetical protein
MPTGRPCTVCSLGFDIRKAVDERLRDGMAVAAVHRWLEATHKVKIPYKTFCNHNAAHVRLLTRAAAKLSDAQRERRDQIETAKAVLHDPDWDAQAFLMPASISKDIFRTSQRLDLAAETAFIDREHASLAQLSAQLLRSAELRGKLGGTISDGAQLAVQVNVNALTTKVVEAMEQDPEKRRSVALTLLGGTAPASALDPVLDLGVIPDPAPSSSSSSSPQAPPEEPTSPQARSAAPVAPPKSPAEPQDGHKRPAKARTPAKPKTPSTAAAEAPATAESPAQPFAAIDRLFGL